MVPRSRRWGGLFALLLTPPIGCGLAADDAAPEVVPNEGGQQRAASAQQRFIVELAWDQPPEQQPAGTALAATASFVDPASGGAVQHLEVVDVVTSMRCCGSRALQQGTWSAGPAAHQVRLTDLRADQAGIWRVKISARVDDAEVDDAVVAFSAR